MKTIGYGLNERSGLGPEDTHQHRAEDGSKHNPVFGLNHSRLLPTVRSRLMINDTYPLRSRGRFLRNMQESGGRRKRKP